MEQTIEAVGAVLQRFQDGYTARDVAKLDEFMTLFAPDEDIELIGIGAAKRAATEWFIGPAAIRDIVEGDWTYWGNVQLDVAGAQIHVRGGSGMVVDHGRGDSNAGLGQGTAPVFAADEALLIRHE